MRTQTCSCLQIAGCDEPSDVQSGYQSNAGAASRTPQLFPDAKPLLFSLEIKADMPYKARRKREERESGQSHPAQYGPRAPFRKQYP